MNQHDLQLIGQLFEEKLEKKLEEKLEEKFEQKLSPINAKIDHLQEDVTELKKEVAGLSILVHDVIEESVTHKEFDKLEKRVEALEHN